LPISTYRRLVIVARLANRRRRDRLIGHPLVASFEPSEDWRWCYVDETLVYAPDSVGVPQIWGGTNVNIDTYLGLTGLVVTFVSLVIYGYAAHITLRAFQVGQLQWQELN
jgi:hypothetical protein